MTQDVLTPYGLSGRGLSAAGVFVVQTELAGMSPQLRAELGNNTAAERPIHLRGGTWDNDVRVVR
ncbi:MAG: hypothetical protein H0T78_03410 [Longispora sp.]|nr:hypothetical protein [Longispora sp. (in: high G+C Gram-positive bacteria)]